MSDVYHEMRTELNLRRCTRGTIDRYLICTRRFGAWLDRPFREVDYSHVRSYLHHLLMVEKLSPFNYKMHLAALKFLFKYVLLRPSVVAGIPYPRVPKTLPDILSGTEVDALLAAISSPMHRVILMVAYGGGMRISEACALQAPDIDSKRMLIHIRDGKGEKDRYVMLSKRLLIALREYYKAYRPPTVVLFPGDVPLRDRPIPQETVRKSLRAAVARLELTKRVTPHKLRAAFATHLHEAGTDLAVIQMLLGHASIRTTMLYVHVSRKRIAETISPLDLLGTDEGEVLG